MAMLLKTIFSLGLVMLAACSGPKTETAPSQSILFVTIDTLRADHLDIYGYPRKTAPLVSSLAGRGVIFEKDISASSHTAPSHTSMFTSLFPFEHGVLKNHDMLSEGPYTLFHFLEEAGYASVALPAVRFMEGKVGFPLFDPAKDIPEAKISKRFWYRNATQQVNRAIHALESLQNHKPFFLWLHFYDVHEWEGKASLPEQYLHTFGDSDADVILSHTLNKHQIPLDFHRSREKVLEVMNNYDRRIRYVDDELSRLNSFLSERGLDRNLTWVITADHGEGLGNHNYNGHGEHIYNEQLHVPLIISSKNVDRSALRVHTMVRSVDIFPTLADMLGKSLPSDRFKFHGHSLVPLIEEAGRSNQQTKPSDNVEAGDGILAFSQRRPKDTETFRKEWEEGDVFSLQSERYKLIDHTKAQDEFFDLQEDPFELNNLSGSGMNEEALLNNKLQEMLNASTGSPQNQSSQPLNPEEVEELKTLGYL